MHAIVQKALCRTTADIRPKLLRNRIAVPYSQQIYAYHPLYNSMFSTHQPSSAKEQPGDTEEDVMVEAFGHAYATRAIEEGYGEIYGESVKVFGTNKDPAESQTGPPASVNPGEENGRHATKEETVCPLPGGVGGVAA
ncbi:hypothetical protein KI387_012538 [Taxus chinensis]|uniref:Uncharacterized protein n=1 Tax=Taxus chinensis TaxID=29808 RepID=A0AA38FG42_TAXCH|nr:hypothetical protein KI387_012538 [Taxus chinensis]